MNLFPSLLKGIHRASLLTLNRKTIHLVSSLLVLFIILEAGYFLTASRTITQSLQASRQLEQIKYIYQETQKSHLNYLLYLHGRQPSTTAVIQPIQSARSRTKENSLLPEKTARLMQRVDSELHRYLNSPPPPLQQYQMESRINDTFFLIKQNMETLMSRRQAQIHAQQEHTRSILQINMTLLSLLLIIILVLHAFTLLFRRTLSLRFSQLQEQIKGLSSQLVPRPSPSGGTSLQQISPLSYTRDDEFQPMVREFNRLIETIHNQQRILEKQNIQLKEGIMEKEALLREVHHRVKNNLQVIISLLHLQGQEVSAPEAQQALQDSQSRIRSMAMVHQTLYQSNRLNTVSLKDYFQELLTEIAQANHLSSHRDIRLPLTGKDISVSIEQAIPLGLILNDLITWLLRSGRIASAPLETQLSEEEGIFVLTVTEPAEAPPAQAERGERDKELCFALVQILSDQLGGRLDITETDQGVTARLVIPLDKLQ